MPDRETYRNAADPSIARATYEADDQLAMRDEDELSDADLDYVSGGLGSYLDQAGEGEGEEEEVQT